MSSNNPDDDKAKEKEEDSNNEEPPNDNEEDNEDDDDDYVVQQKPLPKKSIIHHHPALGSVTFGSSWERRYQTFAMFSCSLYFVMPTAGVCWGSTIYYLLAGIWNLKNNSENQTAASTTMIASTMSLIYLTYIFVLDQSPTTGSRPPLLRKFRDWWNHSCDYLPLLLVKTADLPAGDNNKYVLGYHPHGIISVGCFGAFATDGAKTLDLSKKSNKSKDTKDEDDEDDDDDDDAMESILIERLQQEQDDNKAEEKRGFSSLFPGLDRRVITLPQNFTTPFLREYFLFMGACTSAKETFRNILKKPDTAVIVVVGGAAESMHSKTGSLNLVLETRRGFVREAILAGACLVPVIAFGENDLYEVYETENDSFIGRVQDFVKKQFGFAMPMFQGRSIFFLDKGVMPQRKPVNVVVGKPLPPPTLGDSKPYKEFAPQVDRKTDEAKNKDGEILKEHHTKYIQALEELYNQYKNASWNKPGRKRKQSMRIVKK